MEHVEVLRDLSEVCRAAIKAGDWKVDGACDPDAALRRADAAIASLSAQPPAEAQPVAWDSPFGECICNGGKVGCPGCNPDKAIELAVAIATNDERRKHPPCMECGAATPKEAETKCICSGDKDDCHGCELWLDPDDSEAPSAPVGVAEAWEIEPVEDDADTLVINTPDGKAWIAQRGDRVFELAQALALAQQPAAVDGDKPYPAPRNRQEAAALAKLALAYLGVTSAHIDAAVARCETDLAGQPGGSDNDR